MALLELKMSLSDLQRPLVSREGPLDLERALSDLKKDFQTQRGIFIPREGLLRPRRPSQT